MEVLTKTVKILWVHHDEQMERRNVLYRDIQFCNSEEHTQGNLFSTPALLTILKIWTKPRHLLIDGWP